MQSPLDTPRVTVVVPVRDEAGNIAVLVEEIERALADWRPFEIIYVDDASSDATGTEIAALRSARPWLRCLRHAVSCGKSAAVRTGVRAARADVIISMDGDGQNDPAFIPLLLTKLEEAGPRCGLVKGQRVGRKASGFKRLQSRLANAIRSRVLNDGTRDTGGGLECFRREAYRDLPYFDALHRYMPALFKRAGYTVAFVDIVDRPRHAGRSKYGFYNRLAAGIFDLVGVSWLLRRCRWTPTATEVPHAD
jgi:glycosyltransferase involved in cell wall biosynthesis